ncbi:DNA-3-methyladenine glycosylase [Micrococcus sp. M4NT]|uniref:DNA-3-methyladenine glycosylase n=1 Tax=Micrococcus sp. M4NT TaxID=2957501 RepID=UPI0029A0321D|nr:DNA-3-methyladenine glycosylase [Micrococcus sp. M4NT]MDX2341569.1 DNA-3-methyladenine glycosylase [Micrococcus sp. M4NT]
MNRAELSALFEAHPTALAEGLLGCRLTVAAADGAVTVRLTETEAYGDAGVDPGAHSFRGRTERNAALFGPVRHTYVYLNYGIHKCLNLVGHPADQAGGVLLRAGEVVDGRGLAVGRRGRDTAVKLLSGPGNLGQGLGITLAMGHAPVELVDDAPPADSVSLAEGPAADQTIAAPGAPADAVRPARFLLAPPPPGQSRAEVRRGPRVGVSGEGGSVRFPWRFHLAGEASVSAYRAGRNVPPAGPSAPSAGN